MSDRRAIITRPKRSRVLIGRKGGGKGGGGGGSPEESPDSLRSIAYAHVLVLLGEGQIKGPARGNSWTKSTFLNEVVVESEDGTFNYQRVTIEGRLGTPDQSYIAGITGAPVEIGVGVELLDGVGVVKTITNPDVNRVRVTIGIPRLVSIDGSGDLRATYAQWKIELRSNGGPYVEVARKKLVGKSSSRYQQKFMIPMVGDPPWDIRVTRIWPDSVSAKMENETWWDSYTEIIDAKFRYPHSALAFLRVDAKQFPSLPRPAFDLYLLEVKVPTNYDPETRTYTGTWDGTFKVAWTDNPAWCFYDLATKVRYGTGRYITEAQLDKWAFYQIGQYCDQLISNGFGGLEPRFTCNVYIQSREQARKVLADMASVFRGMLFWAAGGLAVGQDAPTTEPPELYGNANVIGGKFQWQGSPRSQRHSVALVSWNDPADFYKRKIEYVEDPISLERYGYKETGVIAFACTSRGQAHRVGKWLLYSERAEDKIGTFKVGLEGLRSVPGKIAKIADAKRAGKRISGRITAATSSSVTLDRPFTFAAGVTYTLYVIGLDAVSQTRTITNPAGAASVVTVDSAFATTPIPDAVWIIGEPALEPETVCVLGVSETEAHEFEVSVSRHNPGKFDAIEQGLILETPRTSTINTQPAAPSNMTAEEFLYEDGGQVRSGAFFGWTEPAGGATYEIAYTSPDGDEVLVSRHPKNSLEVRDTYPGVYAFRVRAINLLGYPSPVANFSIEILGKLADPADVTGLAISPLADGAARLTWDRHPDLDVRIDGQIIIRFTPEIGPAVDWEDGIEVDDPPGASTSATVAFVSGTYLVKALDSSGRYSINAAKVEVSAPSLAFLPIGTIAEHPTFPGTRINTTVLDGKLRLAAAGLWDSIPQFDVVPSVDNYGGLSTSGSYLCAGIIDCGAVFAAVRLEATIKASAFSIAFTVDNRPGNVDSWSSWDGGDASLVSARLYVSPTNDDPLGAPTWGAWQDFTVANYAGRAFRFLLELETESEDQNINVEELAVSASLPRRVEGQEDFFASAAGVHVSFERPFYQRPAIGITPEDLTSGDKWTVTNQTATGFDVIFRNSVGTAVARTFDWMATGYGAEIV
jgi:hypothetical protein